MSWEKVKLGDVTDSCLGKMLDQVKNKGEYEPYLANLNVRWGYFELDNLSQMRFESGEQERYGLKYGDLVICEGGEPGRCAIWKDQIPNMKIQKALHRVRVHDCLDYRYLYYWFLYAGQTKALEQYFTGATIKHMPGDKLKSICIDFPPKEVQQRISEILWPIDSLIESNQKQIKLLEEAAQRLYKEWFVDLRFPGHENTKIVDGIPEGWMYTNVQEMAQVLRRGISPRYSDVGKSIVINQKCIRQSIMDITEARRQEKSYPVELNLQDNDVVICSTGAGTLGRVGQVFGTYPNTTFDSHVTLVRGNCLIGRQLLYHAIKSKQAYLMGRGKGSTNQLELSRSVIQELPILLPSSEIMGCFEAFAQSCHDKICVLNQQNKHLKETRDRFLPKLMNKEIK